MKRVLTVHWFSIRCEYCDLINGYPFHSQRIYVARKLAFTTVNLVLQCCTRTCCTSIFCQLNNVGYNWVAASTKLTTTLILFSFLASDIFFKRFHRHTCLFAILECCYYNVFKLLVQLFSADLSFFMSR